MTLPPQVPMTSCSRPELGLSWVQFPGTPCETLYQSPSDIYKSQKLLCFQWGGHVNPSGAHVPSNDPPCPPAWAGVGGSFCLFSMSSFGERKFFLICWPFSLSLPHPLRAWKGERLLLGGGARTVAGFPTAGGQEPAALTGLLHAQHHPLCQAQGRKRGPGRQPPPGKECSCSPSSILCPACSSTTESPPNKDFIFSSGVQGQRQSPKLFPSILNISGGTEGPVQAGSRQHQDGGTALQDQRVCMCVHVVFVCCHCLLLPKPRQGASELPSH